MLGSVLVLNHVLPADLENIVVIGPLYDDLLYELHGLRVSVEKPSSLDDTSCKFRQPDRCSFTVDMV